ncbi:hypothetical protein Taro_008556 [Colocasia esculenta]|uniref:Uncharacterized protein n=1 Tax=Colocasia esculenta TaxID=4460 RepID=A0A843TXZ3_COLES|nr:hypothetical protein [Colocasia esculenta]
MDTSRVLSGASSSASQTSAFTTPGAPGNTPSVMMGFNLDTIFGLVSRLAQTMKILVSNAVQALSQAGNPPQAAPSTSARAPHEELS